MKTLDIDRAFLIRCLSLAAEAVTAGDKPFGSILVNEENEVIAEARNRVNSKSVLSHPEYELAAWAYENLDAETRAKTRMYTTGEHCPMCAGAHAWVGLGSIIYLSSAEQLQEWLKEFGVDSSPIIFHPVENIVANLERRGPGPEDLVAEIKKLHALYFSKLK